MQASSGDGLGFCDSPSRGGYWTVKRVPAFTSTHLVSVVAFCAFILPIQSIHVSFFGFREITSITI